jgi:hypothetical protein
MPDTTPAPSLREALAGLIASLRVSGPSVSTRGWKTYLAAAAMAGYGVLLIRTGDAAGGVQAILTAAAMAGLRSALPTPGPTPAPPAPGPAPGPSPAPGPANRPVLKTLAAVLVALGSFFGLQRVVPPVPGPGPSPAPIVPPAPAPRPADPFDAKLYDAYAADGGPTAANAAAKDQLAAVYRAAAQASRDPAIATGEDLAKKVSETAKTLLGRHYLTGLPTLRVACNSTVIDTLDAGPLTDASRSTAADLFARIADALGRF